jgi:hypothetical protein
MWFHWTQNSNVRDVKKHFIVEEIGRPRRTSPLRGIVKNQIGKTTNNSVPLGILSLTKEMKNHSKIKLMQIRRYC